jgi:hypothetical protein
MGYAVTFGARGGTAPVPERVTRGGLDRACQMRSFGNSYLTHNAAEHAQELALQPLESVLTHVVEDDPPHACITRRRHHGKAPNPR